MSLGDLEKALSWKHVSWKKARSIQEAAWRGGCAGQEGTTSWGVRRQDCDDMETETPSATATLFSLWLLGATQDTEQGARITHVI